jgi:poly(A) polymerase
MTDVADQAWFRDPGLQRILALLNDDGGEARIVGGAVRNSLMGIAVSDMDIATTLRPEAVQLRAEEAGIKCVPTGLKHGTVTLVVDGRPFEVTTLRRDVETDGRHAEVEFTSDWKADAERRDLTINALYVDQSGVVHDYTDGLRDIETGMIRFIGSAAARIEEDHLRILRFFRFFAYYGRGRPDAEGLKASAAARKSLGSLSAERVWAEMKKLLSAADPFRALLWMRTAGVLTEVLPETEKWGIDSIPVLIRAEAKFGWSADPLLRLAAIVPPVPDRLRTMTERLKMSSAERRFFEQFSGYADIPDTLSMPELRKLLYRHGTEGAVAKLRLAVTSAFGKSDDGPDAIRRLDRLRVLLDAAENWQRPVFPVKGADLVEKGFQPGPEVGAALARLEEKWLESEFELSKTDLIATLIQ